MTTTRRDGYSVAVDSKQLEHGIERVVRKHFSGCYVEQSDSWEEERRGLEGVYEDGRQER